MNIGMAVGTVLPHVGKDRPEMALRAVNFFVCAAKWIPRSVVVEFGDGANRGPAYVRMTVLARNGKRTVGTSTGLPLRIRCASEGKRENKENELRADLKPSGNNCPP
jgi:hypothetical protein